MIEIIEGYPFPVALKNASQVRWSGILRAVRDAEQVGVVVMHDGHIAWAVSNMQTENFGSLLERVGMVPKEKLDEVVSKYRSLGKTGKLDVLLEETGLITHAALRECLMAHVRAAISSMLDDPRILLEARNDEMSIDAGMMFLLSEVYPETEETPAGAVPLRPVPRMEGSAREEAGPEVGTGILEGLSTLPGYLYSFVSDMSGKVMSFHASDGMNVNTDNVVPAVLAWLSNSSLSSVEMQMGKVLFAFVQCETGALFVHMTDTDIKHFVAVACNEDAKLGVVKHKISEMLPFIRSLSDGKQ